MSESFFSASWYRVRDLRPRVRGHLRLHRHVYRGQRCYVLEDPASGRNHRLSGAAHLLIGLMDGERTVQQVWDLVVERLGDDAPTQDETIRLLGLLHFADALLCDVAPDTEAMLRRTRRRERDEWWRRWTNPLSIRVPLFDPDALLERLAPWCDPLFSRFGAFAAIACLAIGAMLVLTHAEELVADVDSRLLAPSNWIALAAIYVVAKALHELGHGIVAKRYGCAIHEMGIVFLVLIPMPYLDASSTAVLPEKRQRMAVSAAGIAAELLLASLAVIIWWAVEPGVVRAMAYDLLWLCGVSTLVFNGNPLMRFDAYYVLADALEIPNLATRSRQYAACWVQRRIFGIAQVRDPVEIGSERPWLAFYGVAAFLYRIFVVIGIALFLSGRFFVFGLLLAIASIATQILLPIATQIADVLRQPRFDGHRARIVAIGVGASSLILLAATWVPLPLHTFAEGVLWPPEGTQVRAKADGFVVAVLQPSDSLVQVGEPLIRTRDPLLASRVKVLDAQIRELRAEIAGRRQSELVKSQIAEEQLAVVTEERDRARSRLDDMLVSSPASGRVVLVDVPDLVGRHVAQGDLLGYVVRSGATARVVVSEDAVDRVRSRTDAVQVRRASGWSELESGTLLREVPAAEEKLPHAALGTSGGGRWVVAPSDPDGLESPVPVFQFDIALSGAGSDRVGERVFVRFEHPPEPLARRAARGVRRLFLSRLGV